MNSETRRSSHALLFFAGVTALAATLGGYWTDLTVKTWYPALAKPAWTPPSGVFGPVWTLLYASMAVAAWRVWRKAGWVAGRYALVLYFVQLTLNTAWPGLFFGLRSPAFGALEIVLLWIAILLTLRDFWRVDRVAGFLFVPYLAWVTYAAALNVAIWQMNG
jgi:benzodiazapine receptor